MMGNIAGTPSETLNKLSIVCMQLYVGRRNVRVRPIHMKRTFLTVSLLLVLMTAPLTVSAAEDPQFQTYVSEPTLEPGQTTQLTVQIENDNPDPDQRVDTAQEAHATMLEGDTPFSVNSGVRLLGDMRDGQRFTVDFSLSVPKNIDAGTYRIPIRLTYRVGGDDDRETSIVYAQVRVKDHARFQVVDVTSDTQVGDTGTVAVQLQNVGSENASDASVALQSSNAAVTFGQASSASRYVGNVDVNETVTVEYETSVASDAEARPYALTANVEYDDPDGNQQQSAPLAVGVTPLEAQSFSLSNVQSNVRVGEEGTLEVTVTNDGPQTVSDAVVRIENPGMNIDRLETEYAVGTLESGQSTTVRFPLEVATAAEPGPKQFVLRVDYVNNDDDPRQSDGLRTRVDVAEQRDRFGLDPVSTTLEVGQSGELVLAVTNNGDDTVSNVNAKLFADDPIGASDDEAFITELEPGETDRISFGVSAAGGALEKAYPVSLDFQYDVGTDTKLSKTYTVAVDVTTPEDSGGLPIPYIVGGLIVVLAIAGYVYYQRR